MSELLTIRDTRSITTPSFEATGHYSHTPLEVREQIPAMSNPNVTIGLGYAAQRNIKLLHEMSQRLEPGQNIQADLNKLSSYRDARFYQHGAADRPEFRPTGVYVDETLVDTNVDPYTRVVETFGIQDVPSYPELLENGTWEQTRLGYLSPEYQLARAGLGAMFYMRGQLPDSAVDFDPQHRLGVAIYSPSADSSKSNTRN